MSLIPTPYPTRAQIPAYEFSSDVSDLMNDLYKNRIAPYKEHDKDDMPIHIRE